MCLLTHIHTHTIHYSTLLPTRDPCRDVCACERFEALPRQSAVLTAFVHDTFSLLFPSVRLPSLATTRKSCHDLPCWNCVVCIMPCKTLLLTVKRDRGHELWDLSSTQNYFSYLLISVSKWKPLGIKGCHSKKHIKDWESSKAIQFGGEWTKINFKTSTSLVV